MRAPIIVKERMRFLLIIGIIWVLGLWIGCSTPPDTPMNRDELRLKKYPGNYTCFKLELGGATIITDPFNMNELVQADIVTTSHQDPDHVDFTMLGGSYKRFDTAGSFNAKGIKILGVAGQHNKGDRVTTNIIYVFEGAGIRLAQFASQGEMPTEEMFARIGTADILILQILGEGGKKLSPAEACAIARKLKAKIIIPAHTDTELTSTFTAGMGVPCERISEGELKVMKNDLAAQPIPRIIVLDNGRISSSDQELKTGI